MDNGRGRGERLVSFRAQDNKGGVKTISLSNWFPLPYPEPNLIPKLVVTYDA